MLLSPAGAGAGAELGNINLEKRNCPQFFSFSASDIANLSPKMKIFQKLLKTFLMILHHNIYNMFDMFLKEKSGQMGQILVLFTTNVVTQVTYRQI